MVAVMVARQYAPLNGVTWKELMELIGASNMFIIDDTGARTYS